MVLVDTSVWIEIFRNPPRIRLETIVELDEIVTCLPVIQEVLQGFRDERAHATARDAMLSFPVVESPLRTELILDAVDLYRHARRAGKTIRSGVDCLIAACAIRNRLEVAHLDRDFDSLASVSPLAIRRVRR